MTNLTPNLWLVVAIFFVASLVLFVFLVRVAARANEQVSLLKALNEKQDAQIALLRVMANEGSEGGVSGKVGSSHAEQVPSDERKNPELIFVAASAVVIFVAALIIMIVK